MEADLRLFYPEGVSLPPAEAVQLSSRPVSRICSNSYGQYHLAVFLASHLLVHLLSRASEYRLLRHYAVVWLAIMTSPKGAQLDCWLVLMCFLDVFPLFYSLFDSWRLGLFDKSEQGSLMMNVAHIMGKWSPAYQFNHFVLTRVDGSFVDHLFVILVMTTLVTEGNGWIVRNFYCKSVQL